MPRAIKGVLVECDPSIKSIILKIDADDHAYIVEELDEEHLVVKETMVNLLKQKLQEHLAATVEKPQLSGSE